MSRISNRNISHYSVDSAAEAIQGLLLSEETMTNRIDVQGFSFSRDLGVDAGRMRRVSDYGFNAGDYRRFELNHYGLNRGIVVFRLFRFQDMELLSEDSLFPSGWHINLLIVGTGAVDQQDLSMIIELDKCLRDDELYRTEIFLDHIPNGAIKNRHRKRFHDFLRVRAPYLFEDNESVLLGRIFMGMALSINDDVVVEFLLRCAIVAYYGNLFISQEKLKPRAIKKYRRIVNAHEKQMQ